jgi:hypothetical protein
MLAAMARVLGWVVVTVLLGGAAYELALALGFESTRVSKGEDAPGEVWVFLGALIAMLVGAGLAVAWTRRPRLDAALLAPAAAAFVAAFFFTYDPYYAPGLERYSERDVVNWAWFSLVVALGIAVGALTPLRPRLGAAATSIVLLLLLMTAIAAADGH